MSLSGGSDIALSGSISSLLDVFRTFSRYHSDKDPASSVLVIPYRGLWRGSEHLLCRHFQIIVILYACKMLRMVIRN
jgi:hypothetical protein